MGLRRVDRYIGGSGSARLVHPARRAQRRGVLIEFESVVVQGILFIVDANDFVGIARLIGCRVVDGALALRTGQSVASKLAFGRLIGGVRAPGAGTVGFDRQTRGGT
jgi:hypothetical protein